MLLSQIDSATSAPRFKLFLLFWFCFFGSAFLGPPVGPPFYLLDVYSNAKFAMGVTLSHTNHALWCR